MKAIHYLSTVIFASLLTVSKTCAGDALPLLPQAATSFGATFNGDSLYIYGGNTGKAHEFNKDCVKGDFFRLKWPGGEAWEKLPGGLALLSSSLVSYEGKVIRIGGMNAHNEKGSKNDLFSTDEVMCFDPTSGTWQPWPNLPDPRSSHDAVILGHILYVAGGWKLSGDDGDGAHARWCDSMLTLDLQAPEKGWRTQPQPFQRRAIAAVAQGGRIWFIGGMNERDEQSRAVDWFDPATGQWGKGPDLPDGPMKGFGAAACEQKDRLYVSPLSGHLLELASDGQTWNEVATLKKPRFFHRLLALNDGSLIAIGGSNHQGQIMEMETIGFADSSTGSKSGEKQTDTAQSK